MSAITSDISVLHVDDEPDFAAMAGSFIERANDTLEIVTASSTSEGLERLAEDGIDCVVSDYEMPGRDGIEFLKAARRENPTLPFILYTGKGSEEVASEAILAGVTDYLQKGSGSDRYELLANRITNAVEKDRAEREVKVAQQRFRRLIENSTDIITVIDNGGVITYQSPSIERILGYAPNELVGEDAFDHVHPDDREGVFETFSQGLVTEVPIVERETYRFKHKDGSWVWLDTVGSNQQPGLPEEFVLNSRDITKQRRRERELRRNEMMVNESGDLIYAADSDGYLTSVNDAAAEFVGYPPDDLIGEHVSKVVTDSSIERGRRLIQELLEEDDRSRATYDMEVITVEGQTVCCENHLTLLTNEAGEFSGTVGVVRDTSGR